MVKVDVRTIWMGKVAIRDKYVDEALDMGEGIVIAHGDDFMEIPANEIKRKIIGRSELPVKDKFSRAKHFLIYFKWEASAKQAVLL
jgi:hypothetical protein